MLKVGTYTITGFVLNSSRKVRLKMTATLPTSFTISPSSTVTYLNAKAVESISGGDTGITYEFTFILGHYVPPNGAISILFPEEIYPDFNLMQKGCSVSGGILDEEFNGSTCRIVDPFRADLILVNSTLS